MHLRSATVSWMTTATLREAQPEDAAPIAAIYRPYVTDTVITFEVEPPGASEFAERMAQIQELAPWLVCEVGGSVVGYAYASKHHERAAYQWALNAAVYLSPAHHRRGLGRALYTSLFELLRLQGFCSVHGGITLPNAASVGLHESMGFRRVALYPAVGYKQRAWHDVGWWQLELCPRLGEPPQLMTPAAARTAHPRAWQAGIAAGERLLQS
jgi:L-amino acid N-acyltransferase YncA